MIQAGLIDHEYVYPYANTETYSLGAKFLSDCKTIEDWGCGRGWLRNFRKEGYKGIDMGVDSVSAKVPKDNPFADVLVNLMEYRSDPKPEGIFMRHVLEHNFEWKKILSNAVSSFDKKLFLCIFTPFSEGEQKVLTLHGPPQYPFYDPPVPNLSFKKTDVTAFFQGLQVREQELKTGSHYGQEFCFYVSR